MKKRNTLYLGAAFITFVVGIAAASVFEFSPRVFRVVSQDGVGGPGVGASGRGVGVSMKTWLSSDGLRVEETSVSYSSPDIARSDFELELDRAERIIDGGRNPSSSRVVAKFDQTFVIISVQHNQIKYVKTPYLDALQAVEKCWLKFG